MDDIVLGQPHTGILYAFDGLDQPIVGEAANFSYTMTVDGVKVTKTVTFSEVDAVNRKGEYQYALTPDVKRIWYLHITLPGYDELGWEGTFRVVNELAEDISGAGDRFVEFTLLDDVSGDPITQAQIKVYDVTSTYLRASGLTGADGKRTLSLFDGSYKVYLQKIGDYTFTIPEDLTVTEGASPPDVQVTYQGTAFSPTAAPAGQCTIYGWETDASEVPLRALIRIQAVSPNYYLKNGSHVARRPIEVYADTDNEGYWKVPLAQSSQHVGEDALYNFNIDGFDHGNFLIPTRADISFKDLKSL